MQEGVESICKFVVSGCDTAELLEAIEESFDEVSCLVAVPVDIAFGVAIASRRDDPSAQTGHIRNASYPALWANLAREIRCGRGTRLPRQNVGYRRPVRLCPSAYPAIIQQSETIVCRSTFADPCPTSKFQDVNTNRLL